MLIFKRDILLQIFISMLPISPHLWHLRCSRISCFDISMAAQHQHGNVAKGFHCIYHTGFVYWHHREVSTIAADWMRRKPDDFSLILIHKVHYFHQCWCHQWFGGTPRSHWLFVLVYADMIAIPVCSYIRRRNQHTALSLFTNELSSLIIFSLFSHIFYPPVATATIATHRKLHQCRNFHSPIGRKLWSFSVTGA